MDLEKLLISVIIVSIASVGLGAFMIDLTGRYGTQVNPEFQSTFNKYNESFDLAESITSDIKEGGVEQTSSSDFDFGETVKAGINVVKSVFVQGIPTVFSLIMSIGDFIPVPPYVLKSLQAMALISVGFALVYLFFRYKNG